LESSGAGDGQVCVATNEVLSDHLAGELLVHLVDARGDVAGARAAPRSSRSRGRVEAIASCPTARRWRSTADAAPFVRRAAASRRRDGSPSPCCASSVNSKLRPTYSTPAASASAAGDDAATSTALMAGARSTISAPAAASTSAESSAPPRARPRNAPARCRPSRRGCRAPRRPGGRPWASGRRRPRAAGRCRRRAGCGGRRPSGRCGGGMAGRARGGGRAHGRHAARTRPDLGRGELTCRAAERVCARLAAGCAGRRSGKLRRCRSAAV
jgi:hypothetical protein